jgi:hypothetical protein
MKSKFVYTEPNEQYREWLKTNPIKKLTPSDEKKLDDEIRKKISDELNVTGEFDIAEFMLLHKWYEVREFVSKQDPKDIEEVKNLIWKPKGRSDFRRIVPELVLTSDSLDIKKINFCNNHHHRIIHFFHCLFQFLLSRLYHSNFQSRLTYFYQIIIILQFNIIFIL